jgi:CheY-like chemotaxis protein
MAVVLVVNDDDTMLDVYASVLQSMGHEPVTKLSVDSGVETVQDIGAQALVVDLQGPGGDPAGLRIIEEVRADSQMGNFPIVLCSGAPEVLEALRPQLVAMQVGVVVKPFTLAELEAKLRAALDQRTPA